MTAAYVLAEELDMANGDDQAAFRRYEKRLRPYIVGKQNAAMRFASSFAPKTRSGSRPSPPCHAYFSDTDNREVRNRRRSGCGPAQAAPIYVLRTGYCLRVCELPPISLVEVGYDVEQSLQSIYGASDGRRDGSSGRCSCAGRWI